MKNKNMYCSVRMHIAIVYSMLVNKKENKLKKGTGFHLDIMIMSMLGLVNGVLGLPFAMGAGLRAVAHTSALTVYKKSEDGSHQLEFKRIREQRITGLFSAMLIGNFFMICTWNKLDAHAKCIEIGDTILLLA